jgi:hypothetical protein
LPLASLSHLASFTGTTLAGNMMFVFFLMLARFMVGCTSIPGFLWTNSNTNKAVKIGGSDLVHVDLGEAPKGLTMEANTQDDPIGSVCFQFDSLDRVVFVDSKARYFACRNKGSDNLPCDFDSAPASIAATIYSMPNATGMLFAERTVLVDFYALVPPIFKLMLVSPGKPDRPLTTNMMIHLASMPTMSVRMDYDSYKNWKSSKCRL